MAPRIAPFFICIAAFYHRRAGLLILAASILLGQLVERFSHVCAVACCFFQDAFFSCLDRRSLDPLVIRWPGTLIMGFCLLIWAWRAYAQHRNIVRHDRPLNRRYILLRRRVYFFATEQRKVVRRNGRLNRGCAPASFLLASVRQCLPAGVSESVRLQAGDCSKRRCRRSSTSYACSRTRLVSAIT